MATTISVVGLVAEWGVSIGRDTTTGTRKYIAAAALPDRTAVMLPDIGEAWDATLPNLVVANIDIAYLNDDPACGKIYTVQYNTNPVNTIPREEYPIAISMSGQMDIGEVPDTETLSPGETMYWDGGNTEADEDTTKRKTGIATTTTISITQQIYETDFEAFIVESTNVVGKINSTPFMFGYQPTFVRYLGCNARELTGANSRRWLVDLNFEVRVVHKKGGGYGGWNYVFDIKTGLYRLKTLGGGADNGTNGTFRWANFTNLLAFATSPRPDTQLNVPN